MLKYTHAFQAGFQLVVIKQDLGENKVAFITIPIKLKTKLFLRSVFPTRLRALDWWTLGLWSVPSETGKVSVLPGR